MQKIAWETICNYKKDDVECTTETNTEDHEDHYRIFQNSDQIQIISFQNKQFDCQLFDINGISLWKGTINQQGKIPTSDFISGLYFIRMSGSKIMKVLIP